MFCIYNLKAVLPRLNARWTENTTLWRPLQPHPSEAFHHHTYRCFHRVNVSSTSGCRSHVGINQQYTNKAVSPQYHSSVFQLKRFSTSNGIDRQETQWKRRVVGAQQLQNLKVGPYKRGKWFVSYKDDPGSFITNILILLVTGYSIFTMMPGESMKVRRQRKLRQVLLDNAQMTEADLAYIEDYKLPEEENATESQTKE